MGGNRVDVNNFVKLENNLNPVCRVWHNFFCFYFMKTVVEKSMNKGFELQ